MNPRPGLVPALVLVATPLGNLGDLSDRARRELVEADTIVCEDSRRSGLLLHLSGIDAGRRLFVVNDHNEAELAPEVTRRVAGGQRVVVITDAGTPGISDPGERLVAAALSAGLAVEVAPGPSAVIAALVISGLPAGRFCFEGFLPRKGSARSERLAEIAREQRTTVLYEAPHRLARTLADLLANCGQGRLVAVARELTKLHEEVFRGTLGEAVDWAQPGRLGEMVLVLAGADAAPPPSDSEVDAALNAALTAGESRRDAAAAVAAQFGLSRRALYGRVIGRPSI